jgi:lipopolysaccharide/colanic/teichoic acid biosynthesis glycosyltransferase
MVLIEHDGLPDKDKGMIRFMRWPRARIIVGELLLFSAAAVARWDAGEGRLDVLALIFICAWALSLALNDKYTHKYPQRYLPYLIASHLKAGISMALVLWVLGRIFGRVMAPPGVLWKGFLLFSMADALVSLFWRRVRPASGAEALGTRLSPKKSNASLGYPSMKTVSGPWEACRSLGSVFTEFIEKNLPDVPSRSCQVLLEREFRSADQRQTEPSAVSLVVSGIRLNDVRRLNKFFISCAHRLQLGGYFAGRYLPLENAEKRLRRRYRGFLYIPAATLHFIWRRAFPKIPRLNALYFFLTKGKKRVFSKTEIWGRLESCGMRVATEATGEGEVCLLAQKVADPVLYQRPSYYPLISLARIGLNGTIIYAHKIRTMYPFSEFLQKRIYEAHSIRTTGKFADDFRITRYGRFLRKYWLDEIPQIWDWWCGDIKFVGLRAMSRHYFSLYPKDFQDLYLKVKPGLFPPIFSESTAGFEQIVEVEEKYLESYLERPVRTDIRYFLTTVKDIFIKGVRSH